MSDRFVETGQTFTEDGAAYCPVEKKQRGAMGVFASLVVLAGGASFLAYAILSEKPAPAPEPAPVASPEAIEFDVASTTPDKTAFGTDNHTPIALEPATEGAANALPEPVAEITIDDDLIADALAESRAARAAADGNPDYSFRAPSLKAIEVASSTTPDTDQFAPSLKPVIAAASLEPVATSIPRAVPINSIESAKPIEKKAAPDPIYLPEDADRRYLKPAIAWAGDLARDAMDTSIIVARGETFVDALKRAGVNAADRNLSAYAFGEHYNLRRLKPGQEFKLRLGWPNRTLFQIDNNDQDGARLLSLEFRDGIEKKITVRRDSQDGFAASETEIPLTTKLHDIAGRIDGSLYLSAKALGAPDDVIAGLADAFAYDVDFQREIFGGDEFEVLFRARYDDLGHMAPGGDILYARLNWRGRAREKGYYRFEDKDGNGDFYDATGQSAKRLLMKTPIDGARLSSGFGRRKHPILGYARAHKGVDFAANRGTPIKAAGDGVIERADRYGSFGNYVRIRHANGYKTAYAHLNGFARGIRKGKRVRQGDIIGYVGTTGRSTGPHLHYEVHLNGVAVNPQRLKIATGKQLKGAELDRFRLERDRIDLMRAPPAQDEAPVLAADDSDGKENL